MVHDSQAYRKMDMAKEHISFIFGIRDMLLYLQISFSFVRVVVVYADLERTSCSAWSSVTLAPGHLKLVHFLNFCPLTLISLCHLHYLSLV